MNFDIWPDSGDTTDPFEDVPADDGDAALNEDETVVYETDDSTITDDGDEDGDDTGDVEDTPQDGDDLTNNDETDDSTITDDGDDLLTDDTHTVDVTEPEIEGTDPHANDIADDDAFNPQFPAELDLDPMPQPVDGQPWSDPDLLGDDNDTHINNQHHQPPINDLAAMDGQETQNWDALAASQDPAVSSLARWWQP
ncbi:MAG TPA: hypothetical protein H9902_07070 [Candidatus Stackebrandtia faecavium]|nr:hypothetical protein [Candidatus Stackebrandtia faecavium]